MSIIPFIEAQTRLQELIDQVSQSHKPVFISGQNTNAILISEDDWRGIQETVYLLSIPTIGTSIHEGLQTPISECSEELD